jgi:hypothetical protein
MSIPLTAGFNDRKAMNAIRDSIQANLTDPRQQYENKTRNWVHTDNPLQSAAYPRIQVVKRGPTQTIKSSLGSTDFVEWRAMVLDVHFWTKPDFKWSTGTETLKDEELVKEYLDKIWVTLKADLQNLQDTYSITGLKPIDEEEPFQEPPDSHLFTGTISLRLWYFRR